MSTVIYPSPIFGPVHSRRLGISLGVNLMPGDGKICTFDCVYCECGLNKEHIPHEKRPSRAAVAEMLEKTLRERRSLHQPLDVITFAGNGEPTAHPDFPGIIDDTVRIRDTYFPEARISVLSNSTFILKDDVFEALKKVDNNILKLDTVSDDYIRLVNRPSCRYDRDALVERMKQFDGHCIIQTMFMKGSLDGRSVCNLGDEYVSAWLDTVESIKPSLVMIYTIDRETPCAGLEKATHEELDRIGELVRRRNLNVEIAY